MRHNIGMLDRLIRVAIGLIALFYVNTTPWAWAGLLPLLTGLAGWCPLYSLFGWSTCKVRPIN